MKEADTPPTKVKIPTWLWLGSICWLAAASLLTWLLFWPNIESGKGLKPNEFGDLLAGIFSPLAFTWFVYAVLMQRQELELQREELTENRQVLKDQEKAQSELASQYKLANEISTENLINVKIDNIVVQFCAICSVNYDLKIFSKNQSYSIWHYDRDFFKLEKYYIHRALFDRLKDFERSTISPLSNQYKDHNNYVLDVMSKLKTLQYEIVCMSDILRKLGRPRHDEDSHRNSEAIISAVISKLSGQHYE